MQQHAIIPDDKITRSPVMEVRVRLGRFQYLSTGTAARVETTSSQENHDSTTKARVGRKRVLKQLLATFPPLACDDV